MTSNTSSVNNSPRSSNDRPFEIAKNRAVSKSLLNLFFEYLPIVGSMGIGGLFVWLFSKPDTTIEEERDLARRLREWKKIESSEKIMEEQIRKKKQENSELSIVRQERDSQKAKIDELEKQLKSYKNAEKKNQISKKAIELEKQVSENLSDDFSTNLNNE